jgi:hypothetical protein
MENFKNQKDLIYINLEMGGTRTKILKKIFSSENGTLKDEEFLVFPSK